MFVKVVLMAALAAIPALATAKTRPAAVSQRVLFSQLAQQCGKDVHPDTLQAVARVESQFNPYAIGVVKGALPRQPRSMAEAGHDTRMQQEYDKQRAALLQLKQAQAHKQPETLKPQRPERDNGDIER